MIIVILLVTIIIYNFLGKYLVKQKAKNITRKLENNMNVNFKTMPECIVKYLSKIKNNLFNLKFPYGLDLKKYIFIKYILSIIFFIVSIINKNSFFISLLIFSVVYFMPNLLIKIFKSNERIFIIKNLRNIVNAMIISLSASLSLEDAIKSSLISIDYKRLKDEFELFINNYKAYGYNMKKAINMLKEKFNYYEFDLFASTLINGENDGNIMKSLEKYNMVLDISYSKYLAKENSKRLLYLTFGTVLSLINIIIIVMYPMFIEVAENLKIIFN